MSTTARSRPFSTSASVDIEDAVPLKKLMRSIIKIFCHHSTPNFALPWQVKRPEMSTSSGFVIEGRRIMCNAHGVAFGTNVQVRRHGDSKRYHARVEHIGHECDLAILTVEDDAFWRNLEPLEMGDVPELQEKVLVLGYPTGGDAICVTEGVVSRVDAFEYSHSGEHLLTIQIDAAINSGNSGGPALCGGRVVGVAFESLEYADNIGYIIPIPVVRHFLADVAREGGYKGFPLLNVYTQATENTSMRAFRRIPPLSALVQAMYPTQVAQLQQTLANERLATTQRRVDAVNSRVSTAIVAMDEEEKGAEEEGEDGDMCVDEVDVCNSTEYGGEDEECETPLLSQQHVVRVLTPAEVDAKDYVVPGTGINTNTGTSVDASTSTSTAQVPAMIYSTDYGRFSAAECVETAYGPMLPISIDGSVYYIQPSLLSKSEDTPLPAPLRTFLTDPDSDNASIGLTVTRPQPLTAVAEVLGSGDVIIAFEDTPIASNNTVVFRGRERVSFTHLVTSLFVGDKGRILFLRHRKFILEAAPTLEARRRLCEFRSFQQCPAYFVFMGMVFLTLSASFLEAACGSKWENIAPIPLLHILHGGTASQKRVDEEVVLLSHVLVSEHNMGYEEEEQQQVHAVNGVPVVNLRHLATLVAEAVEKVNGRMPLVVDDSNSNSYTTNSNNSNSGNGNGDKDSCVLEDISMRLSETNTDTNSGTGASAPLPIQPLLPAMSVSTTAVDNTDRFLRITLKSGSEIVLDILDCRKKHVDILKQHQIPLPGASARVRAVWGDTSLSYVVTEENGKRRPDCGKKGADCGQDNVKLDGEVAKVAVAGEEKENIVTEEQKKQEEVPKKRKSKEDNKEEEMARQDKITKRVRQL